MKLVVQFSETPPINVTLAESSQTFEGAISEQINIVDPAATLSHTKLLDLDAPNQHGIPVIRGLQAELDSKLETLNYATTADIDAMFKSVMKRRFKYNG